jgi:hypothetical protein
MTRGVRVTSRLNEIEASVNAIVDDFQTVDTVLLLQVGIEAILDVLDNGFPAGKVSTTNFDPNAEINKPLVVVDKVAKARCVHDGEVKTDAILLNVYI